MKKIGTAALLAFALFGCSSDAPPGAIISQETTLPQSSLLASLADVSLIRAGDSFTLAGYDKGQVRWGRLSPAGDLTNETSFALPQPMLAKPGPVFAVTQKNSPGDQLIAISITDSTTDPGGYDLIAVAHTVGDKSAGAPVVLATLSDVTDPETVQLAAGAATSGKIGFVAWGIHAENLHIPVNFFLLPAGAAASGNPVRALDDVPTTRIPFWDCLRTTEGPTGLGFSVVVPDALPSKSRWRTIEIEESGNTRDMTYPLDAQVTSCQIVGSLTSTGAYLIAFQAGNAIDIASYRPLLSDAGENGNVTTYKSVLPSAKFGGPLNLPKVVWTGPAGNDFTIGVERPSGPQVFRFTYDAAPHGATLTLRSANGRAGPVAAWVGPDAVYATYTDQVSQSGTTTTWRYFVKIESPENLP